MPAAPTEPPEMGIGPFTLAEIGLVDAPPEAAFDAITRLATRLFSVPVALVSIVEEENDRQFFKSQQGLAEPWASQRQTPLSHSFCQHVKRAARPLVVASAPDHPLVRDNPAIRDLGVMAYLGVPIFGPEGQALGALCVIEGRPRDWTAEDVETISDLAKCVTDEIALRASLKATQALLDDLRQTHARVCRLTKVRESIAEAFIAPGIEIEDRFLALLQAGCTALGMDSGAILKVEGAKLDVLFHIWPEARAGRFAPIGLATSLADVVLAERGLVVIPDVATSAASGRRNVLGESVGAYVGVPMILDGVLYGMLEFSSHGPRCAPWGAEDESVASLVAMVACAHLEIVGGIRRRRATGSTLLSHLMNMPSVGIPENGVV